VCWTYLDTAEQRAAAVESLRRAVASWLAAAPVYDLVTADGKAGPDAPGYSSVPMKVLVLNDAVQDLEDAVNQHPLQNPCPDRLALRPRSQRWDSRFEYVRFAQVTPALPHSYADVLVRERVHYPYQEARAEVICDVGSVYRSSSGDVIVIWRMGGSSEKCS
jgi:hypothetical protein